MKERDAILEDLGRSYSPFHVVHNLVMRLQKAGFLPLNEKTSYSLLPGGCYYVTRNDSSLIAFALPKTGLSHTAFRFAAAHTDSPTFVLKPNPVLCKNGLVSWNVEPYGGMIDSSWLDRPLSFGGRVYYLDQNGDTKMTLVSPQEDVLYIPNVCIHFNRDINSGYAFNPAVDLIPLAGTGKDFSFSDYLLSLLPSDAASIVSFDLSLYNRDKPRLVGVAQEFLSSPRLDDLVSAYGVLQGFLTANPHFINVYCAFDNEEVGSLTMQGANGTFLRDTMHRLASALNLPYEETLARSFLLSVDNAHALHPNHPEYTDASSPVHLNGGIAVKYNAAQHYTSNARSVAFLNVVAKKNDIPLQVFTNRSDLRGGSTLGNLSNNQLSLCSVDIGIPQLAMHSANEFCGIKDVDSLVRLSAAYFCSEQEIL